MGDFASEMARLGEVCEIIMGQSPSSETYNDTGEGLPFYQGKTDFGERYPIVRMYCKIPQKTAQKNNILMSVRAPVGPVNIATEKCCIGRGLSALSPHSNILDCKYLFYFCRSKEKEIEKLGTGSTFKAICRKDIESLTLPLPPLDEQKRIAEVLDKASELINKRKEQIRLMDPLAKSLFIEMFGDPVENPMGWDVKKLGTITHKITDGVHAKPNYTESGMPFISVQNISSGYLNFKKCKYVSLEDYNQMIKSTFPEYGDILYTKVGTYGIPAYVNTSEKFCLYVSVCLIKPIHKLINAKFLSFSLGMPYLKRQADKRIKGIGVPDLHLNQIREFDICYPPLSLQNEFADRIDAIEQQKALLQNGLAKMETTYKALMQEYFG